jgi:hypothetical protein
MNNIPCWNCDGEMKRYGEDRFYWYFECPKCHEKKAELRDTYPGQITNRGPAGAETTHG